MKFLPVLPSVILASISLVFISDSLAQDCPNMFSYWIDLDNHCVDLSEPIPAERDILEDLAVPDRISPSRMTGTLTTIEGNAEGIISLRHQEHMWVTSDKALHIIVNQSNGLPRQVMWSSFDGGNTWQPQFAIPNTCCRSTSDGTLVDNKLFLTYASTNDQIWFLELEYDLIKQTWRFISANAVEREADVKASHPTMAIDNLGRTWTTFIEYNQSAQQASIEILFSDSQNNNWQDPGIQFFPPISSEEESSRLFTFSDGVGLIYSNEDTLYWAYRKDSWPIDAEWQSSELYKFKAPKSGGQRNSHFGVVADSLDNIHFVTYDERRLLYLKFDRQTFEWQEPVYLSEPRSATYMQLSRTIDDRLLIVYDVRQEDAQYLEVLESFDYGESFSLKYILTYRPGFETGSPRMETPSVVEGDLPILQQVSSRDRRRHGLVFYNLEL